MKKYVSPVMSCVKLRAEESIATTSDCFTGCCPNEKGEPDPNYWVAPSAS